MKEFNEEEVLVFKVCDDDTPKKSVINNLFDIVLLMDEITP